MRCGVSADVVRHRQFGLNAAVATIVCGDDVSECVLRNPAFSWVNKMVLYGRRDCEWTAPSTCLLTMRAVVLLCA